MISQTMPKAPESTKCLKKYCVKCGETKLASLKFWYTNPGTSNRLSSYCKECTRAQARERSAKLRSNPEKRAQINEKSKLRERAKREQIRLAKLALESHQLAPES